MNLPPPLNWLWSGWMKFSHVLGMVMSKIILTVIWLTIFSVYGLIVQIIRLFKKESAKETYWVDPPSKIENDMRHQF